MNDISFGIRKWQACTSFFHNHTDQQITTELNGQPFGALTIARPLKLQPGSVKPMLRRRLSHVGKLALWCADQVMSNVADSSQDDQSQSKESQFSLSNTPCVFVSQHGEVGRTTEILEGYAENAEVSPTAFSLSVHNAIAGVYSIANNITANISAVAAGQQSLTMGVLEAAAILHAGKSDQVLCVIYDQSIPSKLKTGEISPDFDFALALLLDKHSPMQISLSNVSPAASNQGSHSMETSNQSNSSTQEHPFLSFVKFLLSISSEQSRELSAEQSIEPLTLENWQWKKV